MGRLFISTNEFDKQWKHLGLDDSDRRNLENEIAKNPQIGAVIQGTGALRKMRFALEGRGKSGGARVLYVDFVVAERIYLITAYPKNQKENISAAERALYKQLIEQTQAELEGK